MGRGMTMTLGEGNLTVYTNLTQDGEYVLDDYFNFINLLYHEDFHKNGTTSDGWNHFKIAKAQTKHWSFDKMSSGGKAFLKETMYGYIDYDIKGWLKKQMDNTKSKEQALNLYSSKEFQRGLTMYNDALEYFNETFGEKQKAFDFEKWINEYHGDE
jgi:hypothetical protein